MWLAVHVLGCGLLQMIIGCWFHDVGVLLCRGNRLLTGSNTRWLRLWEVEAIQGMKPQEKVCSMENRSAAHFLRFSLCLI